MTTTPDDTVEQWLPGVISGGTRVTVENLLRQTSGLGDYDEHLPWALEFTPEKFRQERFRAYTPRDLVTLAATQPVPGSGWAYSNTHYVLAGMIVEAATGHPLTREIHDRIIAPLGLRHTIVAGTSVSVPQPRATGYTQFPGRPDLIDTSVFVPFPDAPMISTTTDVTTFLRALVSGRLLPAAQLAAMKQTVAAEDGERYGLGISWRPVAGCPDGVWSHGGSMPGYLSEAAVAAVAMTWRPGDDRQDQQDRAMNRLVDQALCPTRRTTDLAAGRLACQPFVRQRARYLSPLPRTGRTRWPCSSPRSAMLEPAGFEDPQPEQAEEGDWGEVVDVNRQPCGSDQGFELKVSQAESG